MQPFQWISHRLRSMPIQRRDEVVRDISSSSSPGFDFFLLVVLSTSIATLGLITDSPAVIIGAMLVAPLMSPILGLGMASITGDTRLLQNAASALARGALLAALLSALMTFGNAHLPFINLQDLPKEVLARVHPSPIDLGIALAGGLAAAYALAQPQLSAALPGVAIATALMPPLCTVGIGAALGRWDIAGGAALLFITNAVTIAFASALIFFLLGFGPHRRMGGQRLPRSLVLSAILTALLLIPLTYISVRFFQQAAQNRLINSVVAQEVKKMNGAELASLSVNQNGVTINLGVTIRTTQPLLYGQVINLQHAIVSGLKEPVSLVVNQILVQQLDPLVPPTATQTPTLTRTVTPGPSQTPTYRPTTTLTTIATITSTATPTSTRTATSTATPAQAQVVSTYLPTMRLYQTPGGPDIGILRPKQVVMVLYGSMTYQGLVWVQIQDEDGRVGWIPQIYLVQITLTSTPTFSP